MGYETVKDEPTIYYLTLANDFAIIVGTKGVESIFEYKEGGNNFLVTWFSACDIDGNVLMRINSAAVEIVGYEPLPDDDDTL